MRVLCLTDFPVNPPDRWIWNHLPGANDQVEFIIPRTQIHSRVAVNRLAGKLKYFGAAREALRVVRNRHVDLLLAWESKNGLPIALLRWLTRNTRTPLIILTCAAKPPLHALRFLVQPWLRAVDHITTPSAWEARYYQQAFRLQSSRVSVCELGCYDVIEHLRAIGDDAVPDPRTPYIFSGGLTDRDYATLFASLNGLDVRCVLNTPHHLLTGLAIPPHVEVNELMPADSYFSLLARATVVALPLRPVNHAAGLSVVLDTMSAGKPIVCTDTPVVREYVEDGVTGCLVPAGDVAAMRDALQSLLNDPEKRTAMGQAARQRYEGRFTYAAFARRAYAILCDTVAASRHRVDRYV